MKWYYKRLGAHVHVRVFMSGASCGDLCFRDYEFNNIRDGLKGAPLFIEFVNETPAET